MEIFNKIGNIASETYKKTSKKTGDLAKEAKTRMQMNEDKAKIKDLYIEIGKHIYQMHLDKSEIIADDDINSYCQKIDELSEKIEKSLDIILYLKGKRICENCHTEIDAKVKFCPSCGTQQPEIPDQEPEEIKEVENQEEQEKIADAEIVEDNKEEKE